MTADSVLLTSDVARVCQVSGETVRQWERAGRLQARKTISGVRLFSGDDVARLQHERASSATTRDASTR